ncbi:Rubredoxin [Thermoplasmatales archaeon BRNA1]|nr:Rubredoxin [Thermoplasmatales archaeon BRNA1]
MDRYVCGECGRVYSEASGDGDSGVAPGTPWADLPDDWECPDCGAPKESFSKAERCKVHVCSMCGFRVEEDRGNARANIAPGTVWDDVSDTFTCPVCGCPKTVFRDYHDETL